MSRKIGIALVCAFLCLTMGAFATGEKETAKAKVQLAFWNMPFVTQEVSPEYVLKWEKDVVSAIPNATVDKFYGPGKYKDQRDKFLLQAKSGTPDVIEGLLEDISDLVPRGPGRPDNIRRISQQVIRDGPRDPIHALHLPDIGLGPSQR